MTVQKVISYLQPLTATQKLLDISPAHNLHPLQGCNLLFMGNSGLHKFSPMA